ADDECRVVGGHMIATGAAVKVSSTGTLPAGLSGATTYYLGSKSFNNFALYDTEANAEANGATGRINITDAGTGTHSVLPTAWEGKDFDYQNVRVTYRQGVRIIANIRNYPLINTLATLFGGGDDGIREGVLISDENLTT